MLQRFLTLLFVFLASAGSVRAETAAEWKNQVAMSIHSHTDFPKLAQTVPQPKLAIIEFTVARDGRITKALVEQSSGIRAVDQAALRAVTTAGPFPPMPPSIQQDFFTLHMPIRFVPFSATPYKTSPRS